MKANLIMGSDGASLTRPAWTSENLYAYKDKHVRARFDRPPILKDYYVRGRGLR